ncbi:hypothetical protein IEQ34_016077 [Dendrobium chrysotoxum]|uniref:Argonaute 4 n=1 Tax=Dendrobium chrysotoxum TaxID=161865 RepID=A0AAV7GEH3_DENCH|nr:hypothetical protein IEQ34_016077 [Dendrobium chrysotoxum]
MEPDSASKEGKVLPLPPLIPPHVVPTKENNGSPLMEEHKMGRVQMERPGLAEKGQSIALLTNHFKVSVRNMDEYFFHYSVNLKGQDDQPIGGKGIGRKVIDEMQRTYKTELGKKGLAYDGEKNLFTISPLPQINNEFPVMLDNIPSNKSWGKTIKVELSLVAEIPMQSIDHKTENSQEALRVLVIMLRQHAVKKYALQSDDICFMLKLTFESQYLLYFCRGCHPVRRSFFHDNQSNYTDLGGGVIGCRGFHSSLRPVQGGLSLNIDVATAIIVRPGPVIEFLIANQNVRDPFQVDWEKAKRMLKNLRVKIRNMEFKIIGLTELPCNQQTFTFRPRGDCGVNAIEITVYEYFVSHRRTPLSYSADFPCIKVGKPKNPAYFPIELCNLVSLQRYTKGLTVQQRASFMEKSRQKPQEKMSSITNALKYMKYDSNPMLQVCGGSISTDYTQVEGRVLQPPKLIFGNGEEFLPRNGRWNLSNKLGGMNSLLQLENTTAFPIISKAATIILGMDVSHSSPGRSDVPSIAAVVSSRQWPLISKYRASVRTQSPKEEMIDSMFKLVSRADGKGTYDEGILWEAFVDFYVSSGKRKPEQIIIFRDGVSENQFNKVLNVELNQIKEACKFLDEQWFPKITLITAQKKHHTKFFLAGGSPDNVPPGTVVDKQVCHPGNYNFYMCSQAGMIGTSRPTHYHILFDENELNPDDLQELVHSLSYVYQRSTTAISVVAPIYYAHLAASQAARFIKLEESETSSSEREIAAPVPELPRLHMNVRNSMFFC